MIHTLVRTAQALDKKSVHIPQGNFSSSTFQSVMNIFLGICGSLTVLMITIGGVKYIMSMGEPTATKRAKDTILYAIIGLFIVLLSGAIVNFVLDRI